jgi:hypothetical protein
MLVTEDDRAGFAFRMIAKEELQCSGGAVGDMQELPF